MKFETAVQLRVDRKVEEALDIFLELAEAQPSSSDVMYQIAWCMDLLEREKEAVPYYEKAIELGLNKEDLIGAYLGLGSTYRTIGEYEKALALFNKAILAFPNNNEYRVFRAMVNYNLKNHSEAMKDLLLLLSETSSDENISLYKNAIEFYSDKLDQQW